MASAAQTVHVNGIDIYYRFDGIDTGPVLMMAHAMGTSHRLWDWQIPVLADRYSILRYDWRGHGDTSAPPGPYTLTQFVDDALALMDALSLERVHWVGISTFHWWHDWPGYCDSPWPSLALADALQHDIGLQHLVQKLGCRASGSGA